MIANDEYSANVLIAGIFVKAPVNKDEILNGKPDLSLYGCGNSFGFTYDKARSF